MTTLHIDPTPAWVPADLSADPVAWSRETIRHRAGQEQIDLPGERVELLADILVPALKAARQEDAPPIMLMFLLPAADRPSVCSVSVRVEEVDDVTTVGDLLEGLRLPEEMLEQPVLEEVIETGGGPATHLVQRYRAPVTPGYEMVQEHEVFVWRVTAVEGDLAIYLSTSYVDLVAGGVWRPELVELARSLIVVPGDRAPGA